MDDARLSYERRGSGPTAVFIQGVGVAGCGWRPQVDELREEYDCVTFDNRGVGSSSGETRGLTIGWMVEDTLRLLDRLDVERAHFVGHSMGGVIAHQLALDHPERVLSLSLLCTFSRGKDAVAFSWPMLWHGLRTSLGTSRMRGRAFARMVMPAAYVRERGVDALVGELGRVFGRDLAQPPRAVRNQLGALSRHDSFHRLGELAAIPTLVLSGAEDPIARPEFGRKLADAVSAARYVEVEGASHALPIQRPELVTRELREHWFRAAHACR